MSRVREPNVDGGEAGGEEDRDRALQVDSVDFAIEVERVEGLLIARRADG